MPVRRGNAYGVTLVELMITLAVAAILITLATPSLMDFIDKNRVKGVAEGVASTFNDARSSSVKRGRDIAVAFGGTTTAWCVGANAAAEPANAGDAIPAASACDCTNSAQCLVGGQRRAFETTEIQSVSIDALPSSITYDSRLGTLPLGSTLPTVTFTSPKGKYDLQLTLTPLGQTKLCVPANKPVISGYPSC
jgi:prepilin-type N-terminal cleavage/methylation domain-containing protein